MANAPSVVTFHDFFKDVYCVDDDKTDDEMPLNFNFDHSDETLNHPFTNDEILKCIAKLKKSKSPGLDDI